MNDSEKLHHLAGEVNALMAFIAAVISTHPNIHALSEEFHRLSETQEAVSLPISVSEHFLEGQAERRENINNLIRVALARAS